MRSEPEVLDLLKRWAAQRANVRAVILTGSRADPRRQPDVLSDYDVEVFVRSVRPFTEDDAWVSDFGEIMVRWPAAPRPTFSDEGDRLHSVDQEYGPSKLTLKNVWTGGLQKSSNLLQSPQL